MNELAEPIETIRQAKKRAPVIWQIASVNDKEQSVTVVFPVAGDGTNVNESVIPNQQE